MNPNKFSTNASPAKVTLHPNLQAALSSLNVDLEEELERFREEQAQAQGLPITQSQLESTDATGNSSLLSSSATFNSELEAQEKIDLEQIDSYLASSEELLRHLNQEEKEETSLSTQRLPDQNYNVSQSAARSSWRDYLLTPLGIAGILIFFLSGTLLSMILVDLAQVRFSRTALTVENSASSTAEPKQQSAVATDSSSPSIPNRPNLAKDEFIELDVDNLVEAEPAAEVAKVKKPSCGGDFYCVVVENPNQEEYQKSRQLFADAYLREFSEVGQVLQVAAFTKESQAKNLQNQLEQQGITATIYYP
jgi:hypothetical protein